jgi:hypothetical protein
MRSDMAKVIVERPRYGSSMPSRKKGYLRSLKRQPVDELSRRESMLGLWHGRQRYLNEHLGPMRRFLRSRVGRPWNKVHRELCEYVSFNNAVQKHVLTHVFDFVRQFVEVRDGEVRDRTARWRGRRLDAGQMYICPTSGLLKVVKPRLNRQPLRRIIAGPLAQYHLRDNVWWKVSFRETPADPDDLWDLWLERCVTKIDKQERLGTYGADLVAIAKRPLRPDEAKQLLRSQREQKRRRTRSRYRDVHSC